MEFEYTQCSAKYNAKYRRNRKCVWAAKDDKGLSLDMLARNKYFSDKIYELTNDGGIVLSGNTERESSFNKTYEEFIEYLEEIGFELPYNYYWKSAEYNYDKTYEKRHIDYIAIPYINFPFYEAVIKNSGLPIRCEELCKLYLEKYMDVRNKDVDLYEFKSCLIGDTYILYKNHVLGRIYKGYCSFIRELQLYYFLRERGFDVRISFDYDIKGVDLVISYNGATYYIASYVDDKISKYFSEIKADVRHKDNSANFIRLEAKYSRVNPSPTDSCYELNGFWLYKESVLRIFAEDIKNGVYEKYAVKKEA